MEDIRKAMEWLKGRGILSPLAAAVLGLIGCGRLAREAGVNTRVLLALYPAMWVQGALGAIPEKEVQELMRMAWAIGEQLYREEQGRGPRADA